MNIKKTIAFTSLLLSGLSLAACQNSGETASSQDKTPIVIATAGDIKPFAYEDGGDLTGYDIEVLKAAGEHLDKYEISFKTTAWESIFIGLDSGKFQGAANNLSYTEERALSTCIPHRLLRTLWYWWSHQILTLPVWMISVAKQPKMMLGPQLLNWLRIGMLKIVRTHLSSIILVRTCPNAYWI